MPKKVKTPIRPVAAAAVPVAPYRAAPDSSTYINVVIDRSASMKGLSKETVGGFNKFLAEQQAAPGKAMIRIAYFDDKVFVPVDGLNIQKVKQITEAQYWEGGGGMTALFDAVGVTIEACKKHIEQLAVAEKPAKVMFLIITDGQENSSQKFHAAQIKSLITEARDALKWEFIFLGANIDAITAAAHIGITRDFAANYTASEGGTHAVYAVASQNMIRSRGLVGHAMGASAAADVGFSQLDRDALMVKIPDPVVPVAPKK